MGVLQYFKKKFIFDSFNPLWYNEVHVLFKTGKVRMTSILSVHASTSCNIVLLNHWQICRKCDEYRWAEFLSMESKYTFSSKIRGGINRFTKVDDCVWLCVSLLHIIIAKIRPQSILDLCVNMIGDITKLRNLNINLFEDKGKKFPI